MELWKVFSKDLFSYDDLCFLNELLKTGMPIKECLKLIKNRNNEGIIDNIICYLDKGYLIENIITHHLPKQIDVYLTPLVKTIPFNDALDLSLSFYKKSKDNENEILKNTAYPFILLFVSITALYLFDLYGLDSIFSLLASFNANLALYKTIRILIRIIIYVFYFGLLVITILALYFSKEKRVIILYEWISKTFPNSFIKTCCCEELVSLLLICQRLGYKTRDSLIFLKSLIKKPIVSVLAFRLDESLLSGNSLNEASDSYWYDSLLNNYIKIASYTKSFEAILENYVLISQIKIKNKMKKISSIIQLTIYVFIGLIIIFVYQILFLPMQAMTVL